MPALDSPPISRSSRAVAIWLLACCALVFVTVVVGGVTRLTHSGLSIVEWQPLVGTIPPMSDAQWQESFEKYRATPDFRVRNPDMTLEGFKGIFWWEYAHRLLGRLIGLVFLVPFIYFVVRGRVSGALAWKLGGIFLLGGLQGALGWYMVQSGLVDDPRVSSVRLAAHLGLAFLIYALMLWVALGLLRPLRTLSSDAARKRAGFMVRLTFVMVLSGALVAAIRAGFAYNTFPLMEGHFIPPGILEIEPWWANILYNMATVQFIHRVLALIIVMVVVDLWLSVQREPPNRRARVWSHLLLAAAALQIGVGIATLLLRVPLPLAALHQAGALIVFTCAIGVRHALREAPQLHS
jgi:cytochrome c oxidase assembly protein subunit 15